MLKSSHPPPLGKVAAVCQVDHSTHRFSWRHPERLEIRSGVEAYSPKLGSREGFDRAGREIKPGKQNASGAVDFASDQKVDAPVRDHRYGSNVGAMEAPKTKHSIGELRRDLHGRDRRSGTAEVTLEGGSLEARTPASNASAEGLDSRDWTCLGLFPALQGLRRSVVSRRTEALRVRGTHRAYDIARSRQ